MTSEDCHDLAASLFNSWYFIDGARRYACVEEKEKARNTVINARAAVYDAGSEGAMTDSEVKALNSDLNTVIEAIEWRQFSEAREKLEEISEQVFRHALQKTVECECGEAKG